MAFIAAHRERFGVEQVCRVLSEHGCQHRDSVPCKRDSMEPFIHIRGTYDSTFDDATESKVREILTAVGATPMWAASFPPSLVVWLQPATPELLARAEVVADTLRRVPGTREVWVGIPQPDPGGHVDPVVRHNRQT